MRIEIYVHGYLAKYTLLVEKSWRYQCQHSYPAARLAKQTQVINCHIPQLNFQAVPKPTYVLLRQHAPCQVHHRVPFELNDEGNTVTIKKKFSTNPIPSTPPPSLALALNDTSGSL